MSPIIEQVIRQLSNFWSISDDDINMIIKYENEVLNRCEYCFQRVDNKYFRLGVNLTHSGQWLSFLYYFSNTLSHNGKTALADKFSSPIKGAVSKISCSFKRCCKTTKSSFSSALNQLCDPFNCTISSLRT